MLLSDVTLTRLHISIITASQMTQGFISIEQYH